MLFASTWNEFWLGFWIVSAIIVWGLYKMGQSITGAAKSPTGQVAGKGLLWLFFGK